MTFGLGWGGARATIGEAAFVFGLLFGVAGNVLNQVGFRKCDLHPGKDQCLSSGHADSRVSTDVG